MNSSLLGFEVLSSGELSEFQFDLLRRELKYIFEHSPYYKRKFKDANVRLEDIRCIEDFIEKVPFTTKGELRAYNDQFICVPNSEIVDIGATTGTTGSPVFIPMTRNDWFNVIDTVTRSLVDLGVKSNDVFQISTAFDQLFSAAICFDYASKRLGITTVRTGPGNLRRQIEIMRRLKTTVIFSTPDFMLLLAREAEKLGLNPQRDFNLRMGIFVGQNLYTPDWRPNSLNRRIRDIWGIEVYSDYGSMEMMASFVECSRHGGHHVFADHFFVEVVDPETGEPVRPGEPGEFVFTHLSREGMPLVRYRQGDIVTHQVGRCVCGRTTPRVMSVIGRVDNMMKIKGVSVYPEQIEEALLEVPGLTAYLIEAYTDSEGVDRIKIKVSFEGDRDEIFSEVEKAVKGRARVKPDVIEPMPRDEIIKIWFSRGTRKPKRFWDRRKKA